MYMKRAALFFILSVLPGFAFGQNFNWITPNRTYLKVYIAEDGIYRLKKSDFTSAGVTTSFDPRTLKMYNLGNQIPVYFQGEQDGVFNDNDFIDFFAKRNYGGPTVYREANNAVAYTTDEYYNQYSDTNVYWIDWGGGNGLRMQNFSYISGIPYTSGYSDQKVHFETDFVYSLGENTGSSDFRYLNTERFRGETWYWTLMGAGQTVSGTVDLPNLSQSSATAKFRVFAYPKNYSATITNEHSLELIVNGTVIDTLYSNDFERFDATVSFSTSLLTSGQNTVGVRYVPSSGFSGQLFLDLFEITYPKSLRLQNNLLTAELQNADTASKVYSVAGYNSSNPVYIYDAKNNLRITQFTTSSDTLRFTAKGDARLEVINDTVRKSPVRIKSRQVPDLVSSANGADYLLVYNRIFETQAEQLRTYRQNADNYRAVKSEIEDIYDIFGYGIEGPLAVRYFVKHVYDNWQQPKLGYVTLFGRGSLDPKKNNPSSSYYQNLVPVYGNPPSDGYFVNFNMGSFFYLNQVSVGRVPVYSASEAQTVVDKIIAYESQQLTDWNKTYTFITGGGTPYEQYYHQQKSNFEAFVYVEPPALSSVAVKVYRSDTSGTVTYNYADSIRNTIDRGTTFVNFRGHAGSHDWEVGMQDPNTLSNGNKLPLILSLTCFTGESSMGNFRGFGERFFYLPNKGAVAFVGSTGWSFGDIGNTFGTYILQSIKRDTVRRFGDMVKLAGKGMSNDSTSFSVMHTVNCYNLIGDAAGKYRVGKAPEFDIKAEDCRLASETILPGETQTLTIFPKNFGLYADTCIIRFDLRLNNNLVLSKDTVYRGFKYRDTISYSFPIELEDIYTMTVTLDRNNRYAEENEANNSVTINVPVKSTIFQALGPVDNSIVYGDSIELAGLNPNLSSGTVLRVMAELDTTREFNSPAKRLFVNNSATGPVTKFRTSLQQKSNGTLYHWRTMSVIDGDSSGWSAPMTFVYGGELRSDNGDEDRFINSLVNSQIFKFRKEQFPEHTLSNTVHSGTGVKLKEQQANLYVRSYGSNGEEASYFSVGEKNIYIDGGMNAGLNLIKVNRLTGDILKFLNLKFTAASSSDSLISFLNTFDSTHYLMLLNAAYFPGGTMMSANARAKMREFGSTKCDSIGLISYFHTWSFIGYLGAAQSDVSEMFDPCCRPAPGCFSCNHWTQSVSQKTVTFRKQYGTAENIVGPANTWTDFSWDQNLTPNSSIVFDVIGLRNDGTDSLLMADVNSNKFNPLAGIDASEFPRLKLTAKFEIDSNSVSLSPELRSLVVNFSPAAEMLIEKSSLTVGTDSRNSELTSFSFRYNNAGYMFISATSVEVFRNIVSDTSRIFTDTVKRILKIDSTLTYSGSFTDAQPENAVKYIFRVKPASAVGEFFLFNNSAEYVTSVSGVNIASVAAYKLFLDGREITGGEIVDKEPEAVIIRNASRSGQDNTVPGEITVMVNNREIPIMSQLSLLKRAANTDAGTANELSGNIAEFSPVLVSGKNSISILFSRNDQLTDSLVFEVSVSGANERFELYNYPNPLRDKTAFIFGIEDGAEIYDSEIRIYTTAGRLIKKIPVTAQAGMNMVEWDGRDEDGDIAANGTYLYKLVSKGDDAGFNETKKLVILR